MTEQVLRGELTHKVLSMCKLKNYGVLECKKKTSLAAKRQACTTFFWIVYQWNATMLHL